MLFRSLLQSLSAVGNVTAGLVAVLVGWSQVSAVAGGAKPAGDFWKYLFWIGAAPASADSTSGAAVAGSVPVGASIAAPVSPVAASVPLDGLSLTGDPLLGLGTSGRMPGRAFLVRKRAGEPLPATRETPGADCEPPS